MKTIIESLNGKLCTIICKPLTEEYVERELAIGNIICAETHGGVQVLLSSFNEGYPEIVFDLDGEAWSISAFTCYITILPALKRNPTTEDAEAMYRLACRYSSEGLDINGQDPNTLVAKVKSIKSYKIAYAVDSQDNRHEIAIMGKNHENND